MFEEMNRIELSGVSYPIKCDMVVLERIQEEYGSIDDFENDILTWEYVLDEKGEKIMKTAKKKDGDNPEDEEIPETQFRWPKAKAVNFAVYCMVNEGMEIEGKERPFKSVQDAARAIDTHLVETAITLHNEFMRCFKRKNHPSTQREK